jgi:hypothetical protein
MNKEIKWNIVNSLLAGALVFVGAFSDGNVTRTGIAIAISASLLVAITQFKKYWESEEDEYCDKTLGTFIC